MNTQILQKCLTELQKEEPDISYLKGMIETLIALDTPQNRQFISSTQQATNVQNIAGTSEHSWVEGTKIFPTRDN